MVGHGLVGCGRVWLGVVRQLRCVPAGCGAAGQGTAVKVSCGKPWLAKVRTVWSGRHTNLHEY